MKEKEIKKQEDLKKKKEIEIKKHLMREIEEILDKQITIKNDKKYGDYQSRRKSIFRKEKEN
jgi:hypothetical protein